MVVWIVVVRIGTSDAAPEARSVGAATAATSTVTITGRPGISSFDPDISSFDPGISPPAPDISPFDPDISSLVIVRSNLQGTERCGAGAVAGPEVACDQPGVVVTNGIGGWALAHDSASRSASGSPMKVWRICWRHWGSGSEITVVVAEGNVITVAWGRLSRRISSPQVADVTGLRPPCTISVGVSRRRLSKSSSGSGSTVPRLAL